MNHRDSTYFPEPEDFRPERWADGLAKRLPKFAYYPFGGGRRICIGNQFALMEGQIILSTIAARASMELMSRRPIELLPYITLRPKGGVHVRVHRQLSSPEMASTTASGASS